MHGVLLQQLRALDLTAFHALTLERNRLDEHITDALSTTIICAARLDLAVYWPDGRIVAQFDWGTPDYNAETVARLRAFFACLLPRYTDDFFQFEPWPRSVSPDDFQ